MNVRVRIVSAVVAGLVAVVDISGCGEYEKLRKGVDQLSHPDSGSSQLTDQQKVKLIDSLRSKGSFEATRDRFTDIAKTIAEQISAAVPGGQQWKFDTTSEFGRDAYANGLPCEQLPGDIALRPEAKPIVFNPALTPDGFKAAVNVVRREAAKYGATKETSLFNDSAKREYDVQGNGYEFRILQIDVAVMTITCDCYLLQPVTDLPAGQLPSEPPIVPTTTTSP
jgi:hypothetical protein